jgi:hypothetical protein
MSQGIKMIIVSSEEGETLVIGIVVVVYHIYN